MTCLLRCIMWLLSCLFGLQGCIEINWIAFCVTLYMDWKNEASYFKIKISGASSQQLNFCCRKSRSGSPSSTWLGFENKWKLTWHLRLYWEVHRVEFIDKCWIYVFIIHTGMHTISVTITLTIEPFPNNWGLASHMDAFHSF